MLLFQVKNAKELLCKMGCPSEKNLNIKVVSVFGNTGEGKSYTLNQLFFNGSEVFKWVCSAFVSAQAFNLE